MNLEGYERNSPPLSAKAWISRLRDALDDAVRKKPSKRLQRLNRQHNSIRSWDLGRGDSATNTGGNGFRLL